MTWSTFYDMIAPTTTATGLQATATSGWRTSSQVVTLTPTDAGGSGVQQTVYSVDGVGNVYTGPFTVSGSGSHVVTYSSTDYATNREVTRTGYVNIDVTPPVTLAGGLMEEKEWRNTPATVRLEASDTQSGVRRTYYELDEVVAPYAGEFTVDRPGSHVVQYWSDDRAGNEERPSVGFVNIDVTAPEVTGATLSPAATSAGWNNSDVTVTIAAADEGGAGVGKRQYAVAGSGVWTDATGGRFTVPAPVGHENDGVHTFDLRAIDRAGNVSGTRTVTVRIDTRAPLTYDSGDDLWHATGVVLSLAADDPGGSGMSGGPAKTEYSLDGGETWVAGDVGHVRRLEARWGFRRARRALPLDRRRRQRRGGQGALRAHRRAGAAHDRRRPVRASDRRRHRPPHGRRRPVRRDRLLGRREHVVQPRRRRLGAGRRRRRPGGSGRPLDRLLLDRPRRQRRVPALAAGDDPVGLRRPSQGDLSTGYRSCCRCVRRRCDERAKRSGSASPCR